MKTYKKGFLPGGAIPQRVCACVLDKEKNAGAFRVETKIFPFLHDVECFFLSEKTKQGGKKRLFFFFWSLFHVKVKATSCAC